MKRIVPLLGVAVVSFWAWAGETDYRSATSAFCAEQGGHSGYRNCGYPSIAACRAAVSGVGGWCYANPQYVAADHRPARRIKKRRYY